MIHFPLAASADFKGKSKMGFIGDTIEEIDWSVGQIMSTLEELKLDENTLVIFTSDNGPAGRAAPPLRGNKGYDLRRRRARAVHHALARQDSRRHHLRPDRRAISTCCPRSPSWSALSCPRTA